MNAVEFSCTVHLFNVQLETFTQINKSNHSIMAHVLNFSTPEGQDLFANANSFVNKLKGDKVMYTDYQTKSTPFVTEFKKGGNADDEGVTLVSQFPDLHRVTTKYHMKYPALGPKEYVNTLFLSTIQVLLN